MMLEDKRVFKTVCAAEKALKEMCIAVQKANDAKAQQGRWKRARTSSASHKSPRLHGFAGPGVTLLVENVEHIFGFMETQEPSVLALVSRAWRDGTMRADALWLPAARRLLPFLWNRPDDNEALKALVRTLGGYRALVMGYAKAVAEGGFTCELFEPPTTPVPDLNYVSCQVIFELRDRLEGYVAISELGQAVYKENPDHYFCRGKACIFMGGPSKVYNSDSCSVEDILKEGRGGSDDLTMEGRFVVRVFVVSSAKKRLYLLHAATLRHDTLEGVDGIMNANRPALHSLPTPLPCATALSIDLQASITFHTYMRWVNPDGDTELTVDSGLRLGLHTESVYSSAGAGLAAVLHRLLS